MEETICKCLVATETSRQKLIKALEALLMVTTPCECYDPSCKHYAAYDRAMKELRAANSCPFAS